jgi:PAS domain S-box-containing protein
MRRTLVAETARSFDRRSDPDQAETKLRLALDVAKMAEMNFDLRTDTISHTPMFAKLLGYPPTHTLTLDEVRARYHPDDLDLIRKVRETTVASSRNFYEIEHRVIWPDGSVHWLAGRGEFTRDANQVPGEVIAVYWDVTEHKLVEERQKLLLDELNHRVKNTLATVQSLVIQTRRGSRTLEEFESVFDARLRALAAAHDLLMLESWSGASLHDVIGRTLAPYVSVNTAGQHRVVFGGPDVDLSPNAAITLHMAFHEMAANACKFGALSTDEGQLAVGWAVDKTVSPALIRLEWNETGGPRVEPPRQDGFAKRLVEQGLERELGAHVSQDYDPGGLKCTIVLPASEKVTPG